MHTLLASRAGLCWSKAREIFGKMVNRVMLPFCDRFENQVGETSDLKLRLALEQEVSELLFVLFTF